MTRRVGRYGRRFNRSRLGPVISRSKPGIAEPGEILRLPQKTKPKSPCPAGFTWIWHPTWNFWYCGNIKAS